MKMKIRTKNIYKKMQTAHSIVHYEIYHVSKILMRRCQLLSATMRLYSIMFYVSGILVINSEIKILNPRQIKERMLDEKNGIHY
jgi:hypothetical protein